jgi:hypothetical protein
MEDLTRKSQMLFSEFNRGRKEVPEPSSQELSPKVKETDELSESSEKEEDIIPDTIEAKENDERDRLRLSRRGDARERSKDDLMESPNLGKRVSGDIEKKSSSHPKDENS